MTSSIHIHNKMCEVNKDFSLYFTSANDDSIDQLVLPYPLLVKDGRELRCRLMECWLDLEWNNVPEGRFKIFNGRQQWTEDLEVEPGRYTSIHSVMQAVKAAIPSNEKTNFSFQIPNNDLSYLKMVIKNGRKIAFGPSLSQIVGRREGVVNEGTTHCSPVLYWNRPQVAILAPHLVSNSFLNNQLKPVLAVIPPEYTMGGRCFHPNAAAADIYKDVDARRIDTLRFELEAPIPIEKKRMTIHLHFHITDQ